MTIIPHQPDDPGPHICPTCGSSLTRDADAEALKLIRKNKGRVEPSVIARALNWSLGKLERFCRQNRIDISYVPPREHEPRGA